MVSEAQRLAQTLEVDNAAFLQGDAERLPFAPHTFDTVTCKLAFHYFPHPQVALAEIRRVTTPKGRVVLVDRVSAEDPVKRAYQNRVEKLRTPAKSYVYSESELEQVLQAAGFVIDERASYAEHMGVEAWIQAAGPTAKVSGSSQAGNSELQVIEMSTIKLHHHDQEDHIVYVARGRGILRMGEKGQDNREVKPGDIINLPRGILHGFKKQGDENLVLLVVASAGWRRWRIQSSTNNLGGEGREGGATVPPGLSFHRLLDVGVSRASHRSSGGSSASMEELPPVLKEDLPC